MKQQDSLHEEGFHGANLGSEGYSSRERTCECGPAAGLFPMVPIHWWYSHIGHRRRQRVLRLLSDEPGSVDVARLYGAHVLGVLALEEGVDDGYIEN